MLFPKFIQSTCPIRTSPRRKHFSTLFIGNIIIMLTALALIGCTSVKTSSELREDGTKAGIYPPPPAGIQKKRIAIIPFEDKTHQKHTRTDLGSQAVDIATTLLVNTERFEVVERERLQDLLDEQELANKGIVDAKTAAKIGKVLGADFIFTGAITDFEITRRKSGAKIGLPSIGGITGLKIGKTTYILEIFMAVDGRVINTETSEVFFAQAGEIKRQEKASGFNLGISDYSIDTEGAIQLDETAAGRQLRLALDRIIIKMLPAIDQTFSPGQ